ncbi:MAG: serine hydrolase domain-containing protein [Bacteroidales bacterium]
MKNIFIILVMMSIIIQTNIIKSQTEIDRYLKEAYSKNIIPGFSVAIVKNGKLWFAKGYGVESYKTGKAFTENTVSAIGSLTKSITALAVMQLVEKGKIDIDKPVTTYIPWFRTANKEKSDKITVRMLLNNTSGLYGGVNPSFDFSDKALENIAHSLEGIYLINEPGKSFEYSNLGFSIAGLVIAKVSGMPYADYIEKNIFEPLKMNKTTVKPEKFESLHSIYGNYFGISGAIPAARSFENESGEYVPAGSITRSNALDLSNYLTMLLQKGKFDGKTIISEKSLEKMWKSNIDIYALSKADDGENPKAAYCLGWMKTIIENREIIYHQGSTGTMSSCTMIDLKNNLAATILMNLDVSFINKFIYHTDINILNNVLRIAGGLTISNYSVPIVKDPTINHFELNGKNFEKYLGTYKFKKGENFVFLGANAEITEGNNKMLELAVKKGSQVLYQCQLDFVNPSLAINRNTAFPANIRFKTNAEGNITGIFVWGTELTKLSGYKIGNTKPITSADKKIKFQIPVNWTIENTIPTISLSDNYSVNAVIKTNASLTTDFESFFQPYIKQGAIIAKGIVCHQTYGNQVWQQITYLVQTNGMEKQYILFCTNSGNSRIFAIFSTPVETLTNQVIKVISPILESIEIINSPLN